MRTEGTVATATAAKQVAPTPAGRVPIRLHVVDAQRRTDLDGIEVFPWSGRTGNENPEYPEEVDARQLLARGRSPVEFTLATPPTRETRLLVRVEGYAVAGLDVDVIEGGEREVALERAADLEVDVVGLPAAKPVRLEVRDLDQCLRSLRSRSVTAHAQLEDDEKSSPPIGLGRVDAKLAALERGLDSTVELDRAFAAGVRDGSLQRMVSSPDGRAVFKALKPATYCVSAVDPDDHVVHGQSVVTVSPGEHRPLDVRWVGDVVVAAVSVAGTLLVPDSWTPEMIAAGVASPRRSFLVPAPAQEPPKDGEWTVDLRELDPPPGMLWTKQLPRVTLLPTNEPGIWRWSAAKLVPGRFAMVLPRFRCTLRFDVPPTGASEVRLVVPPPAAIDLSFVEDRSGREVTDAIVHVSGGDAEAADDSQTDALAFDKNTRSFHCFVPVGRARVRAWPHSLAHSAILKTSVAVGAGSNHQVLRMPSSTSIRVRLRDGASLVPGPRNNQVTFEFDGGRVADLTWTSDNEGGALFHLAKAGHCVLRFGRLDGFVTPPPVELDLTVGETKVVEIPLQRAR